MLDIGHGTQHRVLRWRHSLIIGRSRYNVGHHRHDCLTVHSCLHCVCKHSVQTRRNPVVYRGAHSLAFRLDCGGTYHVLREAQKNTGASRSFPAVLRHPAQHGFERRNGWRVGRAMALRSAVSPFFVLLRLEPTARSGKRVGPRHTHCVPCGSGPTQARSVVRLFRPVPRGRTRRDADGISQTPSLGCKCEKMTWPLSTK
jgi:hypothetical protein